MIILASILSTAIFIVSFKLSGIYPMVLDAINSAHRAAEVMKNSCLDDEAKEHLVKHAAIHLLKRFVQITGLGAIILSLPALFLLALDALAIVPLLDVINFLLKWEVLLIMTFSVIAINSFRR